MYLPGLDFVVAGIGCTVVSGGSVLSVGGISFMTNYEKAHLVSLDK